MQTNDNEDTETSLSDPAEKFKSEPATEDNERAPGFSAPANKEDVNMN
jgi:hypothetical protein